MLSAVIVFGVAAVAFLILAVMCVNRVQDLRNENAKLQVDVEYARTEMPPGGLKVEASCVAPVRIPRGEMSEKDVLAALAIPKSNSLLRAILQVMDGQREELLQDAAEQGIDPAESMARSRGADALRESGDELDRLVDQANAEMGDDAPAPAED